MTRKPYDQSASEKNKILEFARELYLREGFYKTSMDTLTSELRISKKTIYKFFPSKEILVEEVVDSLLSDIQAVVGEVIGQKDDAVTKIWNLHKIITTNILRFNDKWLNDLKTYAPHLWLKIDEFRTRKLYSIFSAIFQQGKEEGLFADKQNEILVTLITASLRAIVNPDFQYHHKYSYQEAVASTFDILFNGFLTKEGTKTYKRKLKENKNENTV